ncbi:MAG: class I adenylate-forming enzyme family protein [Blastomonas sp.]
MIRLDQLVSDPPGEGGMSLVRAIPIEDEPGLGSLTIGGYLREVTGRFGSAEAVVLNEGAARTSWSYDQLWAHSLAVARALIAGGLGRGEPVGILMTNRPEFLSAFFGTAIAGGTAVALSTFSTPEELAHMLKAADISVLLLEGHVLKKDFGAMLAGIEPNIAAATPGALASEAFPFLRRLAVTQGEPFGAIEGWDAFLATGDGVTEGQALARLDRIAPADPGGVFFSSGTTSLPKGIVHDQRSFTIQWWRWPRLFGMRDPVRAWTGNGFFWSGNISMVVGTALSTGGAVILQRFFDAADALRVIEAERVTFANGRPHQWARLQAADGWAGADLSSLKFIPRGELLRAHPTVETDWEVPQAFGTTETMSICTSIGIEATADDYAGSYGVPLPGNTLKIVDPVTGATVPVCEHGEMCIKGPTLMRGYLGKSPEQCFDAEGFYRTGDGGRVDTQGRFFWEGRLTVMIKTGGANVAPEEVDEIIGNWPGVKRCQTVGVADALLGERVVTCIVPIDGAHVEEAALLAHLGKRLASFKLPKQILICTEEDFSVTGNEKVKPAAIRSMAERRLAVPVT